MELLSFLVTLLVVLALSSVSTTTFAVVDTIRPSEVLRDNKSSEAALLVSKEGRFALGFFTTSYYRNYMGIWYNDHGPRVWVANRCRPIEDSSSSLTIDDRGNLVVFSEQNNKREIVLQAVKPLVQLLDNNGNLVLRDEEDANPTNYLWESFDYPTHTLLPGMKLGWDLRRGLNRRLLSSKSYDDPCHGYFSYGIEFDEERHTYPQLILRNGSVILYRQGMWHDIISPSDDSISYEFVYNDDEVYYTYTLKNKSMISYISLDEYYGSIALRWRGEEMNKIIPRNTCDSYGFCGANSECIAERGRTVDAICQCLKGFKPKSQENWNSRSWLEGCVENHGVPSQNQMAMSGVARALIYFIPR